MTDNNMSKINPDRTLNAIGLFCPEPIFRTKLEIQVMRDGQILEVLADDPSAEEDISSWAKRDGHKVISVTKEGQNLRILLKKSV